MYFFTFQAARVSHQCDKLKQTGFYLRTRPYQYSKTSLLELDSYSVFTQAAKLRVGDCNQAFNTLSELVDDPAFKLHLIVTLYIIFDTTYIKH